MDGRFVVYYRVSTARQSASGLGLDGQREAVRVFLNDGAWTLLREFVEVESGRRNDRPQLAAAMAECKLTDAVLLVAKLDRLARNAHFLLGLQASGVEFVATDMPHANRLTVGTMALVAEEKARAASSGPRPPWWLPRLGGRSWAGQGLAPRRLILRRACELAKPRLQLMPAR